MGLGDLNLVELNNGNIKESQIGKFKWYLL